MGPDPLALSGLGALLASDGVLEIGGSSTPSRLLPSPALADCDALIWDALGEDSLPSVPGLPVVALVMEAGQAVAVRQAGAAGVVRRDSEAHVVAAAVQAVISGLIVVDPAWSQQLMRPEQRVADEGELLTARELEVLALLTEGYANREIAESLGVSTSTAKFHVQAILDKMDAISRTEAVVRALRMGIIGL